MPETHPETIWRSFLDPDIPCPEATLCFRNTHCASRTHIVSPEDSLSFRKTIVSAEDSLSLRKTHCLSGRLIVSPEVTLSLRKISPEDTLSLRKTHCLSGRHIVSPEVTLSLPKTYSPNQWNSSNVRYSNFLFGKLFFEGVEFRFICAPNNYLSNFDIRNSSLGIYFRRGSNFEL